MSVIARLLTARKLAMSLRQHASHRKGSAPSTPAPTRHTLLVEAEYDFIVYGNNGERLRVTVTDLS
jgi:hypothetical protein